MNKKSTFLALVASIFIIVSCNDSRKSILAKLTKRSVVSIEALDGHWRVTDMNGKHIEDATVDSPTLNFSVATNRISGFTSCNRLLGKFVYTPDQPGAIHFGSVGTTMMACPEENVESEFLEAFNRVSEFGAIELKNDTIILLTDSINTPLLILQR